MPAEEDVAALKDSACHVVVGTIGRVLALLEAKHIRCKGIRCEVP